MDFERIFYSKRSGRGGIPASAFVFLAVGCLTCCQCTEPDEHREVEVSILKEAWSVATGRYNSRITTPLVVNDTLLFFNASPEITAVHLPTKSIIKYGALNNENNLSTKRFSYIPENGKLLAPHFFWDDIAIRDRTWLTAVDLATGSFSADVFPEIEVLDRHEIVFSDNWYYGSWLKGGVVKFNLNGEYLHRRYQYITAGGVAYWNNTIYAASGYTVHGALTLGRIYALDPVTLDSLWSFNTEQGTFSGTPPVIENGILYAGTGYGFPSRMYALTLATRQVFWESVGFDAHFFIVEPDGIYINASSIVLKLDKSTGKRLWEVPIVGTGYQNLVVKDGYVYHVRDHYIIVIDAKTGEVKTRQGVPDGSYFWHVAANSQYIFAQSSYHIVAYHPWGKAPKE